MDFESIMSTNFITLALFELYSYLVAIYIFCGQDQTAGTWHEYSAQTRIALSGLIFRCVNGY